MIEENTTTCACQGGWMCPNCADKLRSELRSTKVALEIGLRDNPEFGDYSKAAMNFHDAWQELRGKELDCEQAHRSGREQAKVEAIIRCEAQERNRSGMSAAFYVAAMEYKDSDLCK